MTINAQQLATLLDQADRALMSAECHQWLSQARKEISSARCALTKAIRELSQQVGKADPVSTAWLDVQAERRRQVETEGWTPDHDDEHHDGQMAVAAGYYALASGYPHERDMGTGLVPAYWPWPARWWKPKTARENLVRSGALILAEIERLDRAAALPPVACSKAPEGWKCTRNAGHEGPCAAVHEQGGE